MDYASLSLKEKVKIISKYLLEDYPIVRSPLFHRNAFEFLVAVMLSPQTNDIITNKVTPTLFTKFRQPEHFVNSRIEDIVKIIRPINYNKTKAKRIIDASKILIERFDSKVPHTMNDLLTLPGVGRKVANVIINDWYATPASVNPPFELNSQDHDAFNSAERGSVDPLGFVVDTHVMRVSRSLRLALSKTPDKIELELMDLFPKSEWMAMSLRMIYHGRNVFQAKNPAFSNFPKWEAVYSSLGF